MTRVMREVMHEGLMACPSDEVRDLVHDGCQGCADGHCHRHLGQTAYVDGCNACERASVHGEGLLAWTGEPERLSHIAEVSELLLPVHDIAAAVTHLLSHLGGVL